MLIKRLVVVGVGLIGGSFALALRRAGCVQRVLGIGRDQGNLRKALELGVIDEIATEPGAALHGADFVFIATPVRQIQGVMSAIAPHLSIHAVVTDAGSTKQDVAAAARTHSMVSRLFSGSGVRTMLRSQYNSASAAVTPDFSRPAIG